MFPVQDDAPRTGIPVATYLLIAVNVAVFILEISLPPAVLEKIIFHFGVVPARYTQGSELFPGLKYLAFITCMFLHGGWVHLIGNMRTSEFLETT